MKEKLQLREQVNKTKVSVFSNLMLVHTKLGDHDAAMRTCNDVLDLDSDNVKALFRRGVLYGKQKEFAAALVDLKKAIKLDNGNKPARKEFARIKAIVQKRKQADKKK